MKELMHSKKFRSHLFKWLFMYVGVIGLITCAWTYSKYISSFQSDDTARAAKFNVDITFADNDTNCVDNETACNIGSYRPTEEFYYFFKVDTTELEVSTRLAILLTFNEDVNFISLENANTNEIITTASDVDNPNKFSFTEDVLIGDTNREKTYKITAKLNFDSDDSKQYNRPIQISNSLSIGYSAIQIS